MYLSLEEFLEDFLHQQSGFAIVLPDVPRHQRVACVHYLIIEQRIRK